MHNFIETIAHAREYSVFDHYSIINKIFYVDDYLITGLPHVDSSLNKKID